MLLAAAMLAPAARAAPPPPRSRQRASLALLEFLGGSNPIAHAPSADEAKWLAYLSHLHLPPARHAAPKSKTAAADVSKSKTTAAAAPAPHRASE